MIYIAFLNLGLGLLGLVSGSDLWYVSLAAAVLCFGIVIYENWEEDYDVYD